MTLFTTRSLARTLAGTAVLTLALGATAAEVTLTGWAYGNGNPVNTNRYSGAAGGFKGTLTNAGAFDSQAFVTYCIELTESFSFSAQPIGRYDIVAGNVYFGAGKAAALAQLVTYVSADPTRVDTAAESTSFQLAVWNLVYDNDYSVSVAGSFNDSSGFAPYADQLLHGAAGVSRSTYSVSALRRAGTQDFLLAEPLLPRDAQRELPLPGTPALLASALLALGLRRFARR